MKLHFSALLLLAYSVMASANPSWSAATKPVRVSVFVGDLDLHSPLAIRIAQERIHRAAVRLCNRDRNSLRADDREVTAECTRAAESAAVEQLRD
jgi:UrcA family protein